MTINKIASFKTMLEHLENMPWGFELYIPKAMEEPDSWHIMMECMVLDQNDIDPKEVDGVPPLAHEHNYICVLGIEDMESVLNNLKQQTDKISTELFFTAVQHFYANDAYLEV